MKVKRIEDRSRETEIGQSEGKLSLLCKKNPNFQRRLCKTDPISGKSK